MFPGWVLAAAAWVRFYPEVLCCVSPHLFFYPAFPLSPPVTIINKAEFKKIIHNIIAQSNQLNLLHSSYTNLNTLFSKVMIVFLVIVRKVNVILNSEVPVFLQLYWGFSLETSRCPIYCIYSVQNKCFLHLMKPNGSPRVKVELIRTMWPIS